MPTQAPVQNAQQAAMAAAQAQMAMTATNRKFMSQTLNKEVLCQQANGGANVQPWAAGQPLIYNVPSSNNGYLTGFWVRFTGTITLGAGTSAVYALTAAGQLALIDSIQVLVNGKQHDFRPYIQSYITQMQGQGAQKQPRTIVAGEVDSAYQAYLNTGLTTNVGANVTTFSVFIPTNMVHPQDVRGIIPIQNGQSPVQIVVNCAGAVVGPDPELNAIYVVSGTGAAATVAANVSVIAEYKDGQSYSQRDPLMPNLAGMETVQLLRDTQLSKLQAGQIMQGKVTYLHKIVWLIVVIIDGNQSNKFAATSNIQLIRTTTDQNGLHPFMQYGLNTNLDVKEFYSDLCGRNGGGLLKQDIDEGVFPLVYGPIAQQADAGIQEGSHYLNMTNESGWTDWHYGFQCASYGGVTGIQPRATIHAVILNDPLTR